MNSQQEGFHIDVGCYSPPTATDVTITGANGAQPTGGYQSLDPLWIQPSSDHYNGTSFDLQVSSHPTKTRALAGTQHYPCQYQ